MRMSGTRGATTSCSTWHVRIDLVEDQTGLAARANLIGAPAAMTQLRGGSAESEANLAALAAWRPLDELANTLVGGLATGHRGQHDRREQSA